jgi:hypothetical protein
MASTVRKSRFAADFHALQAFRWTRLASQRISEANPAAMILSIMVPPTTLNFSSV